MRRSRLTQRVWTAFARRIAVVAVALVSAALLLPALANADLTISTASTTGVSNPSSCTWDATAATSNVNISSVEGCMGSSSTGARLTDDISGGGYIDFNTAFDAPSCSGSGNAALELTDDQSGDGVEFNNTVDIGGDSCQIEIDTPSGGVTQGTGDNLTVPTLNFVQTGSAGADLEADDNQIGATYGTLGGDYTLDDEEQLVIDQLAGPNEVVITDPGGIGVDGSVTAYQLALKASNSSQSQLGTLDERSGASIDATELSAEGSTIDLPGANEVALVVDTEAVSGLTLNDSESTGLALADDLVAAGSGTVINTGGIEIGGGGDFQAIGTLSLSSTSGSISEELGSNNEFAALAVTASAPNGTVSLSQGLGTNDYNSLAGSAGSGGFTASDDGTAALTLSAISSTGAVDIDDTTTQLNVAGQLSGAAIDLDATHLAGAGGSLVAPGIDLTASTAGDTWVLGAGSVTDGPETPISYSGATSLAVNATGTFNVTASPTTAFTVTGGTPASSTLNYNAQNRTVSGTTSAPTGVIDSPTVQPVNFTNMKAVNLADLGTVASAPITASTQTSPPKCTLSAVGKVIELAKGKKRKAKPRKSAKLDLKASCNEAASLHLTGKVIVAPGGKPRHGSKTYSLSAVNGKLTRPGSVTLAVEIPAAAATALAERPGKSATFSLAATNAGTTGTAKLDISRLR